jgi:hypothetical protein
MYFRITGCKIQLFDNNGHPAAGYEVYTYAAGGSTSTYSYSDRLLTVPNTNPIILSARGEADIYTGVALKLVFTIPGGDPTSPIWEVDYIGEQQANYITGVAVPVTADNHYVVNPTPATTVLSNNLQLTFTPDIANLDTIGVTTPDPANTGPDDLFASGPYMGAGPATFHVEIDTAIEPPPDGPTVVPSADAGVVNAGTHYVKVTALTINGETEPGTASVVATAADAVHKLDASVIPTGSDQVIGRNLYMTKAGTLSTDSYYLVSHSGAVTGPIAIAGLSRAAACIVTWVGHGLSTNDVVVFAGITQDEWVALNSYAGVITWLDADSFSIALDTSGYAAVYDPVVDNGVYVCPTVPGHTVTTYGISVADADLTVLAPTADTSGGAGDTITWQKDGGTVHVGIPITAAPMILMEGFTVQFATTFGHDYGDNWGITTFPAATVNLNGLGNVIIYKNKDKKAVALDGGDMLAGYPAQMIYSTDNVAWLLINPATPAFNTSAISAIRYRKNIVASMSPYTLLWTDQGYELSCTGAITINLTLPHDFANRFVYIKNAGTDVVTVDAGAAIINGWGSTSIQVGPGRAIQLVTNSTDWHILTDTGSLQLVEKRAITGEASVLFTGLVVGMRYRISYSITHDTAQSHALRFNADASGYQSVLGYFYDVVITSITNPVTDGVLITSMACVSGQIIGNAEFQTTPADNTKVTVTSDASYLFDPAPVSTEYTTRSSGAGLWSSPTTDDLTSVTLEGLFGGLMTGEVSLYIYG